jgi:hypothetical protein
LHVIHAQFLSLVFVMQCCINKIVIHILGLPSIPSASCLHVAEQCTTWRAFIRQSSQYSL